MLTKKWVNIKNKKDLPKIGSKCFFKIKNFEDLIFEGFYDGMFCEGVYCYIESMVSDYCIIK